MDLFPVSSEKLTKPAPLTLRDLVIENEEARNESAASFFESEASQEFATEMEILKGHLMLLEKMTQKKSFLLREMKYLLKVN